MIPNDLPFLTERMKTEKVEKLVTNSHDKIEIRNKKFRASIKSWISFEKVHRVITFNQKAWLKSYIDLNTKQKKQKFIMINTF